MHQDITHNRSGQLFLTFSTVDLCVCQTLPEAEYSTAAAAEIQYSVELVQTESIFLKKIVNPHGTIPAIVIHGFQIELSGDQKSQTRRLYG